VALLLVVGCGLCAVFERMPHLHAALKYFGAAYAVWLAWCIARSGSVGHHCTVRQPDHGLLLLSLYPLAVEVWDCLCA